jgi:hypothetical protein
MVEYDVQKPDGSWQMWVKRGLYTYSGQRWCSLQTRCNPNNKIQQSRGRYFGCENKFKGYDSFVDWMRRQIGYGTMGWCLDKDILIKNNKIYSPETCLLLPHELNCLVLSRNKLRGEYPVGVYYQKDRKKYSAQINFGPNNKKHLGSYCTPEEAFYVYKTAKEGYIKERAEEWRDRIDVRAYNALMNYKIEISD